MNFSLKIVTEHIHTYIISISNQITFLTINNPIVNLGLQLIRHLSPQAKIEIC